MTHNHVAPCVLSPEELDLVQGVFDRITSELWFSKQLSHRSDFARYVLRMYARGLVWPEKLQSFCTLAAQKHYFAPNALLKGQRILIVEDDYYTAREAAETLSALGATVVGPIANFAEAMNVAGNDMELDGALLDVNLNGQMVYPVAGFLKMHGVPFAFVTGYDEGVFPAAFRSSHVVPKPTDWASVALQVLCRSQLPSA
ncbi:hypothetical protein [Pararhizobium sp. DWP3-4]|uniref:hypothetical protein n=1 Tax=Pararhizobium sp. DWP3-4 TaxID=2804565 RepID=UPI003CF4CFEC